ncbi:MAG: thioesterase family protein [Micromonosporaceae bacterium]
MELTPGLSAQVELVVGDADTAQSLGSGDVPVLATPRVLALCEAASVAATAGKLPKDATTVGSHVELTHGAPTLVGGIVIGRATLAKVDGKRLWFDVELRQQQQVVAEGRVERVVVDRHEFLHRAAEAL